MKMAGEEKKEPYDFAEDFKELSPDKRIKIILTARNLLEIQKENKYMIAGRPASGEQKER
jgi:hypothetical protein